jgi:predicted DNA-binding protein YlxM (UPF0122 family)
MNYLSLFTGAGGGDLAFQHLLDGFRCVGYVEYEEYCQKVIRQRIKDGFLNEAPIFGDIRNLTKEMVDMAVNVCYKSDKIMTEGNMAAKMKDYDLAVELYNKGLSIQDVADYHSVTRQGMHDILKRRGVKFRPQKRYGKDNHFYRGGITASDRAQNILEKAIEKGLIVRKTHCEKCGDSGTFSDGRTKIQAHHSDYNKPLDVDWLCQPCHHEWHKNNKAVMRNGEKDEADSGQVDLVTAGFP